MNQQWMICQIEELRLDGMMEHRQKQDFLDLREAHKNLCIYQINQYKAML